MRVLRHDGYAWGRLIDFDGRQYDVTVPQDLYECKDIDAAEALIEAVERGADLDPAFTPI